MLHPDNTPWKKTNNRSCVLLIQAAGKRVLLTGDIEKKAEKKLIENWPAQLKADILLAPHHGSKTSSSTIFINEVTPKVAVITAGYLNRYHHPNSVVITRYHAINADIMSTTELGYLHFILSSD